MWVLGRGGSSGGYNAMGSTQPFPLEGMNHRRLEISYLFNPFVPRLSPHRELNQLKSFSSPRE